MNIQQEIKSAKTYQLESLIEQFKRFGLEAVTNTAGDIIRIVLFEAKQELKTRI